MENVYLIALAVLVGFIVGALSAFVLGRRFVRKRSREVYMRWQRREAKRRQMKSRKFLHDITNPLFLIQAFTWSYLDKLEKKAPDSEQIKKSSKEMAEVLHRQANKAIELLKDVREPAEPGESKPDK
jgi:hypothetical protein